MKKNIRKDFCVYKLTRPYNMLPAYIGKGALSRVDEHEKHALEGIHENNHLQKVILKAERLGMKMIKEIIAQNLTNEQAIKLEIALIAFYGREDLGKGPLCNKTDGGEGATGRILSLEVRQQISRKLTGSKHSEKTKKEMSKNRQKEKHPMWGRKHSEETKEYWSIVRKNKIKSPEEKQKIREGVLRNWEKRRAAKLEELEKE